MSFLPSMAKVSYPNKKHIKFDAIIISKRDLLDLIEKFIKFNFK